MPLILLLLIAATASAQTGTLAVINSRIWTADPSAPVVEAMVVSGDRIVAVGATADVQKFIGPKTRVIDGAGKMVTPGFIDSHIHFLEGGSALASVQLRDAKSKAEFVARIKAFAAKAPAGTWILRGEWDHQNWGGELPTKEWIDAVTPNNPVWIDRLDGHMGLANSKALAAAHVTKATMDIAGGAIVRAANGEPTGILKDNAKSLMDKVVPPPPAEMSDRALDAAMQYAAERGVTAVDHMGSWADLEVFERARRAGKLKTRIYAAVPLSTWRQLQERVSKSGRGDDWLRIGALKAFVDGSLGSHTAAFLEPYSDAPKDSGILVSKPEDLYQWTSDATKAGLQVMVHAIGDRAIRTQLDIYERVIREQKPADPRFRIEHAQHIDPADITRFGRLGVIASMQPYHCIDDGRWAEKEIGPERAKTSYAFASLLATHGKLAFGSDWPVAPATPLEGIYAAATRATLDGLNGDGWVPQQKISSDAALRAYTIDGAFARFSEKQIGSLEKGKLADFVILDRDIARTPAQEIRNIPVRMTVVGGQVVYERK
jgi:predicted amidohydrolase YtcJ